MTGTVTRGDDERKAWFSTALRLLVYVLRVVMGANMKLIILQVKR